MLQLKGKGKQLRQQVCGDNNKNGANLFISKSDSYSATTPGNIRFYASGADGIAMVIFAKTGSGLVRPFSKRCFD